jgi:hypothetical protein
MKTKFSTVAVSITLALAGMAFAGSAAADEGKMVGPITKITMAADGKSATAVLKNTAKSFKKTAGC